MRAETKSLNRPLPRDMKKLEESESALDHALEETFPASDPIAVGPSTSNVGRTAPSDEPAMSRKNSKNISDPKKCETEDPLLKENELE